jgi:hypothetical protein
MGERCRLFEHARPLDIERPQPGALGIGDVEHLAVGRQGTAVGAEDRIGDAGDLRAVGQCVVEPAVVAMAGVALAEIGEIEPALLVEHQVVGGGELVAVALGVERLRLARLRVEALDRAALVAGMRPLAHRRALDIARAAVVAEIERAVGPDRESVGPATALREHRGLAVGRDARAAAVADLGQDHRSVGHDGGTFGKAETARQDLYVSHVSTPTDNITRAIAFGQFPVIPSGAARRAA